MNRTSRDRPPSIHGGQTCLIDARRALAAILASGPPMSTAELHAAAQVHRELGDVIDAMAVHLLSQEAYSYREVAAALGITRQAVARRYLGSSGRRPGGQLARYR